MAGLTIIRSVAGMLAKGMSRSAVLKALKQKHTDLSDAMTKRIINKANEISNVSKKTGKPIPEITKKGTGSQTITENVAKVGRNEGIAIGAGGVGAIVGLDALVDAIDKTTSGSADNKPRNTAKRKSPEGGQTVKENRRVVSETKLAKGGALKKAPANSKGLKKLPTKVRNKMGYLAKGGAATKFKPCAGCTSPKTCAKQGCKKKRS